MAPWTALAAALLLIVSWPHAGSAQSKSPAIAEPTGDADPVTRAVNRDALTQLRIAAIALEDVSNQGEALAGIVAAFLKRGQVKNATIDFNVIVDPLWQARALTHFAEYELGQSRLDRAQAILRRAAKIVDSNLAERDDGETLKLISRRQAELDDFAGARRTAVRIPKPDDRVLHLLELGNIQATVPKKQVAAAASKTFELAFEAAKSGFLDKNTRMDLFLTLAQTMTAADHRSQAAKVLDHSHRFLRQQTLRDHSALQARVAAAYVDAGKKAVAMNIVRSLKQEANHARTLASIARAIAMAGSVEGAASLFLLALQDLDAITEPPVRKALLRHIIEEQTRSGLLADAFSATGRIKDRIAQQHILFAMGLVLVENGNAKEALKLVDYIPDMGMRAQIYAHGARQRARTGDRKGAGNLLVQALNPTGNDSTAEMLAEALPLVFEVQVEIGPMPTRKAVFARVRELLIRIPDGPAKVPVMTRLAQAEITDNQREAADRSLGLAWRIAWLNKDKAVFPELLSQISTAQLSVGELLLAFDTAARIPDLQATNPGAYKTAERIRAYPKYKALVAVAVAAANSGQGQLALRAARKIPYPAGRAGAYNAIARALPVATQQAKRQGKKGVNPAASPIEATVREPSQRVQGTTGSSPRR